MTRNTNIKDPEKGSKSEDQKANSLFGQVLKRRKSRQSNYAPGVIDFDYTGDSAKFHHLIVKRSDLGQPDQSRLNFEMKLRTYRNVTEYNAPKPWSFPSVKHFSPRKQWSERKNDQKLINAEYKKKFNDQFKERNANELLH